jgi:foldase protein PrsA
MAMRWGVEAMATMVQQDLPIQACQKAGIKLDASEVDQRIADMKEANPNIATQFRREPYREEDYRKLLMAALAMDELRAKDVTVTQDEVRDYFNQNPGKWDTPDKLEIQAVVCKDNDTATRAMQLLKSGVSDMAVVQQQLDPRGATARVLGLDGKLIVSKPVGKPSPNPEVNKLFAMKDGDVARMDSPRAIQVVRRVRMIPGKVATLNDVKAKVERELKLTRALPPKEVLRKLWDTAKIETDDPRAKEEIKWRIFQDPVAQK